MHNLPNTPTPSTFLDSLALNVTLDSASPFVRPLLHAVACRDARLEWWIEAGHSHPCNGHSIVIAAKITIPAQTRPFFLGRDRACSPCILSFHANHPSLFLPFDVTRDSSFVLLSSHRTRESKVDRAVERSHCYGNALLSSRVKIHIATPGTPPSLLPVYMQPPPTSLDGLSPHRSRGVRAASGKDVHFEAYHTYPEARRILGPILLTFRNLTFSPIESTPLDASNFIHSLEV